MISIIFPAYSALLQKTFSEFLLPDTEFENKALRAIKYVTASPDEERLKRDLTRYKKKLALEMPQKWCVIQWNRSPLRITTEDEFRTRIIRTRNTDQGGYDNKDMGFGESDFNFTMWANDGIAMEVCETLYYLHLYKLRTVSYSNEKQDFKSRVEHELLGSFGADSVSDLGSLFKIDWMVKMFIPIWTDSITGKIVARIKEDIYQNEEGDLDSKDNLLETRIIE